MVAHDKAANEAKARHSLRSDAPAWVPVALDWFEEMGYNAVGKGVRPVMQSE
jgi:hypothetical protein